jgi:heme/copper-type cytochrome/quinol oxidase subunit 2
MSTVIVIVIILVVIGLMTNLFEAFRRAKPPENFQKRDVKDDEDER